MEELLVLFFGAESHHPLDAGAVVPAAVEQDDFSAGGKMRHVALKIPLGAFALAGSRQRRDRADPRIEALRDPLDDPALSRRVAALEKDDDLELLLHDPVLQLHQLALQAKQLLEVDATIHRPGWGCSAISVNSLARRSSSISISSSSSMVSSISPLMRWNRAFGSLVMAGTQDLAWLRTLTFDAHDDCVTLAIVRRETRDSGAGPAVSLMSECGFRTKPASTRPYGGLRAAVNSAV